MVKNYQPYIIFCEVCFRSSSLRDNETYNEVSLFRSCFGIFYYLLERKYRPLLIYRRLGYMVVRHIEVAFHWCTFFDCHQRKEEECLFVSPHISHHITQMIYSEMKIKNYIW